MQKVKFILLILCLGGSVWIYNACSLTSQNTTVNPIPVVNAKNDSDYIRLTYKGRLLNFNYHSLKDSSVVNNDMDLLKNVVVWDAYAVTSTGAPLGYSLNATRFASDTGQSSYLFLSINTKERTDSLKSLPRIINMQDTTGLADFKLVLLGESAGVVSRVRGGDWYQGSSSGLVVKITGEDSRYISGTFVTAPGDSVVITDGTFHLRYYSK